MAVHGYISRHRGHEWEWRHRSTSFYTSKASRPSSLNTLHLEMLTFRAKRISLVEHANSPLRLES
eukprot:3347679-Amphidinium_carterae.1